MEFSRLVGVDDVLALSWGGFNSCIDVIGWFAVGFNDGRKVIFDLLGVTDVFVVIIIFEFIEKDSVSVVTKLFLCAASVLPRLI